MNKRSFAIPTVSALSVALTGCSDSIVGDWEGTQLTMDGDTMELPYSYSETYSYAGYDFEFSMNLDVTMTVSEDLTGSLNIDNSYSDGFYDYSYNDSYALTATKLAKNQYEVSVPDSYNLVMTCDVDTTANTLACAGADEDGMTVEVSFALGQ